jgi:GTP-binding protein HflX
MINGLTQGLRQRQIDALERLTRRRLSPEQLLTVDLAEELCELTLQIEREITVLIDDRGRLARVIIGDEPYRSLPDAPPVRAGLSDWHLLRTQRGWKPPTMADEVTLLQYHLPVSGVLIAGTTQGFSKKHGETVKACDAVFWLHPTDDFGVAELPPQTARQAELTQDRTDWLERGQAIYSQQRELPQAERAVLIGLNGVDFSELAQLTTSAGGVVVDTLTQRRDHPDPKTYLGPGKADELALRVQQHQAEVVIADDTLSPVQQRSLEDRLRIKVIDRTELILDIFAQRAQSHEGQLQVALAQAQYMLPRLTGRGRAFSQQTSVGAKGGMATRGPGETQLETDRRVLRQRMHQLETQLEGVARHRETQRRHRQQGRKLLVALAGYTNAGKSTLLNTLTGDTVLAKDQLFATLDPTTRQLGPNMLITDTVGFIQKLPPTLVKAFRSTLEEVVQADVILHVWDLSDPQRMQHWETVRQTLGELGVSDTPIITVANQIDKLDDWEGVLDTLPEAVQPLVPISAKTGQGLPALRAMLDDLLEGETTGD